MCDPRPSAPRPPRRGIVGTLLGLPGRLLIGLIRVYQRFISPLLGAHCRFTPTCSQYAVEAIKTHPLPIALWLTVKRIARCTPLHPGGHDPVPARKPKQ